MEKFKRTRLACYYSYLSMASVFCVPAMLFVTFHNTYGISYTLLGTLVMINFSTQLLIDLAFTFFSRYFNIRATVTVMPFITSAGLFVYALIPLLFPGAAFIGLVIGTVLFSISAGLSEVLLSPIVASIPSEHPERDMSMLHSLYAWGVLIMVIIASVFLRIFGTENWQYLVLLLAVLPIGAGVLFATSPIPQLTDSGESAKHKSTGCIKGLLLCFGCIFLGSACENIMTNWISGFMENGLKISKNLCDIFGIAVFAVLLGAVRTLYGKYGKSIYPVLVIGMGGCLVCYLTAGLVSSPIISVLACILTGAFAAMLWPGTLIFMEENMPALGVAAYALMAAGGDFGASVAPQLMGVITDKVSQSAFALSFAQEHSLLAEQVGLKAGMLCSAIFPILGVAVLLYMRFNFRKQKAAAKANIADKNNQNRITQA